MRDLHNQGQLFKNTFSLANEEANKCELLISEKGFAKIEIGTGKGKKLYDKRETLKKRDANLEMNRKKREK